MTKNGSFAAALRLMYSTVFGMMYFSSTIGRTCRSSGIIGLDGWPLTPSQILGIGTPVSLSPCARDPRISL
jgi:hypothetical protein